MYFCPPESPLWRPIKADLILNSYSLPLMFDGLFTHTKKRCSSRAALRSWRRAVPADAPGGSAPTMCRNVNKVHLKKKNTHSQQFFSREGRPLVSLYCTVNTCGNTAVHTVCYIRLGQQRSIMGFEKWVMHGPSVSHCKLWQRMLKPNRTQCTWWLMTVK